MRFLRFPSVVKYQVLFGLVLCACLEAANASLLFSEYVEGSSLNKGLEIYNTDGVAMDLGALGCEIRGYQNGSATVSWQVNLTGTIAGQGTYVVADSGASFTGDQSATLPFNGDDAVELNCNGTRLDVIGQIGFDPGSEWGTGVVSTRDNTLRRVDTICMGDDNGGDAFDPSIEWNGFAQANDGKKIKNKQIGLMF